MAYPSNASLVRQPCDDTSGLPPQTRNLYEVLGVSPSANAKMLQEAYFRLKNTYNVSNQALYSMISHEDLSSAVESIEEAFRVLSNEEARANYDAKLAGRPHPQQNTTIFRHPTPSPQPPPPKEPVRFEPAIGTHRRMVAGAAADPGFQDKSKNIIESFNPTDGALFQALREEAGVSLDEMQEHIKISIGYLMAIEENRFELLPQPVYVRGFLKSYLRYLGVKDKNDRLVNKYGEHFAEWCEKKQR